MTLIEPFKIGPRFLPSLRLRNSWLSLDDEDIIIDAPDFEYIERGFRWGFVTHPVDKFECALGFLSAAVEAMRYEDSDNRTLFPEHVMQWAADHAMEIEEMQCWICDEDGHANRELIK